MSRLFSSIIIALLTLGLVGPSTTEADSKASPSTSTKNKAKSKNKPDKKKPTTKEEAKARILGTWYGSLHLGDTARHTLIFGSDGSVVEKRSGRGEKWLVQGKYRFVTSDVMEWDVTGEGGKESLLFRIDYSHGRLALTPVYGVVTAPKPCGETKTYSRKQPKG